MVPRLAWAVDTGTGRDGHVVIRDVQAPNRAAPLVASVAAGASTFAVAVPVFEPGQLVLFVQSQVSALPLPQSSPAAHYLTPNDAIGRFEFGRVAQVVDGGYLLEAPLPRGFSAAGGQVVSVPEYESLTVEDGGVVTALPWDGRAGGVVAFLARGAVTVDGSITASGLGFRGSDQVSSDSGEGVAGVPGATGGTTRWRGGSNAGAGGGRWSTDYGGVPLRSPPGKRLLQGGGGGSGENGLTGFYCTDKGGRGGGVVLVRAGALAGSGGIAARGFRGGSCARFDGDAAGGGAGGTVDVRVQGLVACGLIAANGGAGGDNLAATSTRVGGGGGGGRVYVEGEVAPSCTVEAWAGLRGETASGVANGGTPATREAPLFLGEVHLVSPATPPGSAAALAIVSPPFGAFVASARPVVRGRAPEGPVSVFVDGVEAGGGALRDDGTFTFVVEAPLSDGEHRVQARLASGARSAEHRFIVDTVPPEAPVLLHPRPGALVGTPLPVLEGTAAPGSVVDVSVDAVLLDSVAVGPDGAFVVPVPLRRALELGEHRARATVTDAAGNAAFAESVFSVARPSLEPLDVGCACGASGVIAVAWWAALAWSVVAASRRRGGPSRRRSPS